MMQEMTTMPMEPGLFQSLTEGGRCHQIKSLSALPPDNGKITALVLVRLEPNTPWKLRAEQLDSPAQVYLYFDTLIDMHIRNYPKHAPVLIPWKEDLQRYMQSPNNGFTEFANIIL